MLHVLLADKIAYAVNDSVPLMDYYYFM